MRVAWGVLALLAVMLFISSLPRYYAQLRTPCEGESCLSQQFPAEDMDALRELGVSADAYVAYSVGLSVLFAGVCFTVATAIVWRASEKRMAFLAGLMLVLFGIAFPEAPRALVTAYSGWSWLLDIAGFLGFASVALFINLFPEDRFKPRWILWAAAAWIFAIGQGIFFEPSPGTWLSALNTSIFLGAAGASLGALVYRYLRLSSYTQRQQIKWVVFGIVVALGGTLALVLLDAVLPTTNPLYVVGTRTAQTLLLLAIPITIGLAVLRHRLWDIDPIVNRALVYGALTVCVVSLYVLIVGNLGAAFRVEDNLLISLAATGVVAVLFHPLLERLQSTVNRLMYGERDDPYAVISRLGERLETAFAPDAMLPALVETVREALKLPYAAIALNRGGTYEVSASAGEPVESPLRLPLKYGNEPVGELLLGRRAGEEDFSAADQRLFGDLARQAGVAVHAVRLTADLQRSRERLVTTREEERRRLRRDLHDGLGSQLAGLNVQAGVLRRLIPHDPEAADGLVVELREELRAAIGDIRRLVYDLRPPALDDLGLSGALDRLAEQYGAEGDGLRVKVETPAELPPLPAAVEVAVYRIAQEALTNVVRHARAGECIVRLAAEKGWLRMEITDNGVGIAEEHESGVGLLSMRERAAELGGSCEIQTPAAGGVRLLARLPLVEE